MQIKNQVPERGGGWWKICCIQLLAEHYLPSGLKKSLNDFQHLLFSSTLEKAGRGDQILAETGAELRHQLALNVHFTPSLISLIYSLKCLHFYN